MKMHPFAAIKQSSTGEKVEPVISYNDGNSERPYQINFVFGNKSQRLTMTRDEAVDLFNGLGTLLRFEGAKALEIDTNHFLDMQHHLKTAITPVCSHN